MQVRAAVKQVLAFGMIEAAIPLRETRFRNYLEL
jgi:hypothetical protein